MFEHFQFGVNELIWLGLLFTNYFISILIIVPDNQSNIHNNQIDVV